MVVQDGPASLDQREDNLNPWMSMWALPELAEADARIGDAGLARDALERVEDTTQPAGADVALGIDARRRAPLSDGAAADNLYRETIAGWDGPGCARSSPAPICCTASGCAETVGASTRTTGHGAQDAGRDKDGGVR